MSYHLFECFGIEIETMIVDRASLDVRPLADRLLRAMSGGEEWVEDVEDGPIGMSNELVNHVLEFKTNGPVASLAGVAEAFHAQMRAADAVLAEHGARLLPGGMHPWMDPARETQLWPHDTGPIYRAYDAMYDCRRHGWANLQSVHLNLPFANDAEFARLMPAVRAVLPLVPALAASTPFVEGQLGAALLGGEVLLDSRLEVYRTNARKTPEMTGRVIPEPIYSIQGYKEGVLAPLDRALRATGADPLLFGGEWTNARGAIARFDRMAIEVRLIDAQECPAQDLAVAAAVAELIRLLSSERFTPLADVGALSTDLLVALLEDAVHRGPEAPLTEPAFGAVFGQPKAGTLGELLRALQPELVAAPAFVEAPELVRPLELVLERGTLAQRLLRSLGERVADGPVGAGALDRTVLAGIMREVVEGFARGESFGV